MKSQNKKSLIFIFLVIICVLSQSLMIFFSNNRFGYEEQAESIRSIYALKNRLIINNYTNFGYYIPLLFIYNTFGYSLYLAKFFRLFLYVVTLICLGTILKRNFKNYSWIIPFISVALSPFVLYYNTTITPYGIDIMYVTISVFLITNLSSKKFLQLLIFETLLGIIIMTACLSYPVFIYYLPFLLILYFIKLKNSLSLPGKKSIFIHIFIFVISLFLPFLLSLTLINNRSVFLKDIFHGAGRISLNSNLFYQNIIGLGKDLFIKGSSYYVKVPYPDFSLLVPIITLIISFIICSRNFKRYRHYFLIPVFIILFNLTIGGFTFDPSNYPGIRRFTPILVSLYGIFILSYWIIVKTAEKTSTKKIRLLLIFLGILSLHHLLVFIPNLLDLKNYSRDSQYFDYFYVANTPQASLDYYINLIKKQDIYLLCNSIPGSSDISTCRTKEITAAIKGYCLWNNIKCHNIFLGDVPSKKNIPYDISQWE